jgi:hypothetical protein
VTLRNVARFTKQRKGPKAGSKEALQDFWVADSRAAAYQAFAACRARFEAKYPKAMAYKLIVTAQKKWWRLRGYKLLANVIQGVKFKDGERVEPDQQQDHAKKAVHQI